MKRRHDGAEARVGNHLSVGIFRRVHGIVRVDLRLRGGEGNARCKPGDHLVAIAGVTLSSLAISRIRSEGEVEPGFR